MSEAKTDEPWAFYVFDLWTERTPFKERLKKLTEAYDAVLRGPDPQLRVVLVQTTTATNAVHLASIEESWVTIGAEGVILRAPDASYKFGRASRTAGELLKLKRFDDFEAEVIGVYEEQHNANEASTNALGRTERSTAKAGKVGKDTLGGFVCRGLNDFVGVEFRVGTGFDRAQREELWRLYQATSGEIIGRMAKIKHFAIGAKDKPRFPTFLGFRDERDI